MSKAFLFTGAGFTKNFGGFLADEMWSQIFNNPLIQLNPKLRSLMISESYYDYETAFSKAMTNKGFSQEERDAMNTATLHAYMNLDIAITQTQDGNNISRDYQDYVYPGLNNPSYYWFTLNQDLFIERTQGYRSPGMLSFSQTVQERGFRPWDNSMSKMVPTENIKEIVTKDISSTAGVKYIKLHGSYGWISPDGSQKMVIGNDKHATIKSMPLLAYYLKLFREFIFEGDKIAVVIGYGFRDKHINDILLKGVQDHGLKLIIISPQSISELYRQLNNGYLYALEILDKGLLGYMPVTLSKLAKSTQGISVYLQQLKALLRQT